MEKTYCALGALYGGDDASYFELALLSVLNQTISVPICLVIDGPVLEPHEQILVKYEGAIKHIIRLSENVGLGAALKHAIEEMAPIYDFAIRFDSDDINLPHRFESLIDAIETEGYDLVGSHIDECEGRGLDVSISTRRVPLGFETIVSTIGYRNPFNHPSVAFRIEAVINVGSYEDIRYFEDWYLWAKMIANNAKVGNLDQSLVKFRFSAEMLERRHGLAYLRHEFNFFKNLSRLKLVGSVRLVFVMVARILTRVMPQKAFKFFYFGFRRLVKH